MRGQAARTRWQIKESAEGANNVGDRSLRSPRLLPQADAGARRGNTLFGDDGFGCAVIDYVEAHCQVPEAVCLLDVGTGVRKLLFTLCLSPARPERLIILDAIDAGRTPGEVFEINPSEIPVAKLDDFSLHQLPTSNLLRELQEMCGVEVRVLACQTGPLPEQISQGLSKEVSRRRAGSRGVAGSRAFPSPRHQHRLN